MRPIEILEVLIYMVFIGYFVSTQRKLFGGSAAALEFQQRMDERRRTHRFSLSIQDHKKLNWLGISAGIILCALTIFNALKR